jgi:hypothetical protein
VIGGTIKGVTLDTKDKRTKASQSNQNRPSTHGSTSIRGDQWAYPAVALNLLFANIHHTEQLRYIVQEEYRM